MEPSELPHPVAASRVVMTEIVMPEDTNHFGDIFGGRVLALVDKAGAVAAIRHCRREVLTASIDSVDFLSPVKEGYILTLLAEVQAVFRPSMEVWGEGWGENPLPGTRLRSNLRMKRTRSAHSRAPVAGTSSKRPIGTDGSSSMRRPPLGALLRPAPSSRWHFRIRSATEGWSFTSRLPARISLGCR